MCSIFWFDIQCQSGLQDGTILVISPENVVGAETEAEKIR